MRHDEARREVLADGEAAKHGLGEDAEWEQGGEPYEVGPPRPAGSLGCRACL